MERSVFIDYTKGLLIFLVVFAHFAVGMHENPIWRAVSNSIYTFHMPAFIIISGYLSKGVKAHRIKDLNTLLYPFVLFQLLYALFYYLKSFGAFQFNPFTPVYLTWYMITLFICRLLLPYLAMIKTRTCFVLLFLIMIASGFYTNNNFLASYRTLFFLPLFYLGYKIQDVEQLIKRVYPYRIVILLLLLLIVAIVSYYSYLSESNYDQIRLYFTTDSSYQQSWVIAMGKMVGLLISLFMVLSFFVASYSASRLKFARQFICDVGRNSMSVYVLHGFIVLSVIPLFLRQMPAFLSIPLCVGLSILLCWFFSRKKIVSFFKVFFDFGELSRKLKINIYK